MKHYESISNYNNMLYDSRPVTLNEYVSDKYNIIHKELFNDALDKSSKIEFQANLLRRNIILFKRKLKSNLEEQMRLVDEIEVIDIENK